MVCALKCLRKFLIETIDGIVCTQHKSLNSMSQTIPKGSRSNQRIAVSPTWLLETIWKHERFLNELGAYNLEQLKLKSRIHCPSIWPCLIALFSRFRAFWMHPRFFECIRLHFTDWIFQSPCVFVLWQAASSPITIIRFKRSSPKVVNKLLKCFQIVTFHTQATSSIGVPPLEPSTGASS